MCWDEFKNKDLRKTDKKHCQLIRGFIGRFLDTACIAQGAL